MNRAVSYLGALAALLVLAVALALWPLQPALSQPQEGPEDVRLITVTGQGLVTAAPDTAIVRFGVTADADEPEAALEASSRQVRQVFQRLDELGVPRADIQTSTVRLYPVREQPEQPDDEATITGYRATNTLSVTIDQVEKAGELLAQVVGVGANQIQGIEFQLSDRDDLLAQARAEAIADAEEAAEQFARAAGASVGAVVRITDQSASGPGVPVARAETTDASAVPLAPGDQRVQVNVQVSFELLPGQGRATGTGS